MCVCAMLLRRPTNWSTGLTWRMAFSVCGGETRPPWFESSRMLLSSSAPMSSTRSCWETTMAFRASKCPFTWEPSSVRLNTLFFKIECLCVLGFQTEKCKLVPYLSTFVSFIFQSAATIAKVIGWVAGWRHGRHAYLSAGYGAGEDGCNAEGNVRLSRSN